MDRFGELDTAAVLWLGFPLLAIIALTWELLRNTIPPWALLHPTIRSQSFQRIAERSYNN
jgi:hypothetical protein